MRAILLPMFVSTMVFAFACGGSNPPPAGSPGATTTSGGAAGAAGGSGGAAGSDGTTPASSGSTGPSTTTTTTLSGNGDLSGSKLSTASSSSTQTSGPGQPSGPHQQEPGRSPQDIRTIVMAHRDDARKCYDDALKSHPGIEGDLDLKFTIDPKGNVTDAMVNDDKSSIHEPSVGTCIADIIKKIHFAESQKGFETRAHYPFNFHPKPGGSAPSSSAH